MIHREVLLDVMNPALVHDSRDTTREHACCDLAGVNLWLHEF
jgi:hypothetical protein